MADLTPLLCLYLNSQLVYLWPVEILNPVGARHNENQVYQQLYYITLI